VLSTTQIPLSCDENCLHYRAPIKDPTSQSQELCVKDQFLQFQLNPTVNVVEIFTLRKVCIVEKE